MTQKSNLDAGIPRRWKPRSRSASPRSAGFYLPNWATRIANASQYQKAVEPYQQAIARRPGVSPLCLRRLANALEGGSGQPQQALDALVRATQSEPSNAEAWYDLGLLQSDLGKKARGNRIAAPRRPNSIPN